MQFLPARSFLPLACALLTVGTAVHMVAAAAFDTNRVAVLAGWLPAEAQGLGPVITNRAAWSEAAAQPAMRAAAESARARLRQPLPASPDELFLDFSRTGNRDRWQAVASERRGRIAVFTVAECLENEGRYLPALETTIGELCREKTWVMPAHDRALENFEGKLVEMDLGACMLAWDLATCQWLLGKKLAPATRQLMATNLAQRITTPFRKMVEGQRPPIFWMGATHNWNAVCLAGVTGTALASLPDRQDRAFFAAAAEHYIRNFLKGFPADGYCSEGMGYWNYGFGHFLMLGEALRQATAGRLDLLAQPAAQSPALFGFRSEILNGVYPTIADCSPGTRPEPVFQDFLAARLAMPRAPAAARPPSTKLLAQLALFAFLPEPLPAVPGVALPADLAWRTWFTNGGVLISRPGPVNTFPFAVCLKGGHNAEHHNHNDVGSFTVASGSTGVIADTGSEVYTARTFSGKRYESDALNSFGHAVPVIAGQLQRTGAEARARVLKADFSEACDVLALDYRSAYAVPALTKLERTFTYTRGGQPSLSVQDEVAFSSPQTFETALITWGDCQVVSANELLVTDGKDSVRVRVDTGGRKFKVSTQRLKADFHSKRQPLRIGVALDEPLSKGMVTLAITPMK